MNETTAFKKMKPKNKTTTTTTTEQEFIDSLIEHCQRTSQDAKDSFGRHDITQLC
jgi:flagellum-specific peptidoglycan hydrolase FlgJ